MCLHQLVFNCTTPFLLEEGPYTSAGSGSLRLSQLCRSIRCSAALELCFLLKNAQPPTSEVFADFTTIWVILSVLSVLSVLSAHVLSVCETALQYYNDAR